MPKWKLQYFGLLMQRDNSLEKTLVLGKIEGRRRRGWERMRWLDAHDSEDMSLNTAGDSEGQGSLAYCSPWGHKELDMIEWLNSNIGHQVNNSFNVLHPLDKLGYQLVFINGTYKKCSPALPSNNRAKFLCSIIECTGSKSVLFKKHCIYG